MIWRRLTGSVLLALAGVCAFLGFERLRDFAEVGAISPLRDLAFAGIWYLLLAACLIAAVVDFRSARAHSRLGRGE
jgi:hypothetical protein